MSGIVAFLSVALTLLTPIEARSLGVHTDAAGAAGFLYAPHQASFAATLTRTDGRYADASIFTLSVGYPVSARVFLGVEQPFISLSGAVNRSAFGDATVRARIDLFTGEGRALELVSGLRLGTGTSRVYPYSSQSNDLSVGLAWVDSVAAVKWATVDGVMVKRGPELADEHARHEDALRFGAGAGIDVGNMGVGVGAMAYVFRSGGDRRLLFARLSASRSPALVLQLTATFEAGDEADRVDDASLSAGFVTRF